MESVGIPVGAAEVILATNNFDDDENMVMLLRCSLKSDLAVGGCL